ncbi:MAG: hypothetical protein RJB58_1642 [Pseudomonadota bacterium]|jgi:hypothetical protein
MEAYFSSADWVSAIFAGLSAVGAVIAFYLSRITTNNSFRLEWTREVIGWRGKAVDAMTTAHAMCQAKSEKDLVGLPAKAMVIAQLSSLIDQGRFFFENEAHPTFGAEKPLAYRGYRPILLDHLVFTHDYLKETSFPDASGNEDACKELWELRREFVSELQRIIEPGWLSKLANYDRDQVANA